MIIKELVFLCLFALILSGCSQNGASESTHMETESDANDEPFSQTSSQEPEDWEIHASDDASSGTTLPHPEDWMAEEAPAWQEAYAACLRQYPFLTDEDMEPVQNRDEDMTIFEFSLRDLDADGVPELLISQHDRNALNAVLTVYGYDGNVYKIGAYSNTKGSFVGGFRISQQFPGLFELWWGGGHDHYGYLSVVDGELTYEYLWHEDRTTDPPYQTFYSDRQELIAESINLHPPYAYTENLLEMHLMNSDNIVNFLYCYPA